MVWGCFSLPGQWGVSSSEVIVNAESWSGSPTSPQSGIKPCLPRSLLQPAVASLCCCAAIQEQIPLMLIWLDLLWGSRPLQLCQKGAGADFAKNRPRTATWRQAPLCCCWSQFWGRVQPSSTETASISRSLGWIKMEQSRYGPSLKNYQGLIKTKGDGSPAGFLFTETVFSHIRCEEVFSTPP